MNKIIRLLPIVAMVAGLVMFSCEKNENASGHTHNNHDLQDDPQVGGREKVTVNGVSFYMIQVVGDTFRMGATPEQGDDAWNSEKPVHLVSLSDYKIGETEVTQELWKAVMGYNPSWFKDPQNPVVNISWNNCDTFITKLNQLTGRHFRLPTEAEWEFAARGGKKSNGYKYSGSDDVDQVAWYWRNSGSHYINLPDEEWRSDSVYQAVCKEHKVKSLIPNELGIYDMSGNVSEMCSDWYHQSYYKVSDTINPQGPAETGFKVFRGGSWYDKARQTRVSYRNYAFPDRAYDARGFRLVE